MIIPYLLQLFGSHKNNTVQTIVQLKIPQQYYLDPVISKLVSEFRLKVNLLAAILGQNEQGDSWLDLQLQGSFQQINNALIYLSELDIEVCQKDNFEKQSC